MIRVFQAALLPPCDAHLRRFETRFLGRPEVDTFTSMSCWILSRNALSLRMAVASIMVLASALICQDEESSALFSSREGTSCSCAGGSLSEPKPRRRAPRAASQSKQTG